MLSVAWSVSGLAAVPYFLFTTINYIDLPFGSGNYLEDSAFCALLDINISPKVRQKQRFFPWSYVLKKNSKQGYPMHELSFITFFLLPSGILLYLYISMGVSLRGSIRKSNSLTHAGSVHGDRHLHNSRKQIIRMLGKERIRI